jgi:hypothetical protein
MQYSTNKVLKNTDMATKGGSKFEVATVVNFKIIFFLRYHAVSETQQNLITEHEYDGKEIPKYNLISYCSTLLNCTKVVQY